MSRKKMVRINKKKVMDRLKEMGLKQKELAERLFMNHQQLNRYLHREQIPEELADTIGRLLDLAPEYLADETPDGLFPDAPHNYALHLAQSAYSKPLAGVDHMLRWMMVAPGKLSKEQYQELFLKSYELYDDCLKKWGIK